MRPSITKSVHWTLWLIAMVCFLTLETNLVHAQHKILFLQLRMQGDTIRLVGSNITPGVVKRARGSGPNAAIQYKVYSATGLLLWEGAMDDPSIRRYEFENPEKPGQLVAKLVKLQDVEFTLRIPLKEGVRYVQFYRTESTRSTVGKQGNVKKPISIIEVR